MATRIATKNPTRMKLGSVALSASLLALPIVAAMAEEQAPPAQQGMPMMGQGQGGMMRDGMMPGMGGGMLNPETMQQHMKTMETHMANMEALLGELVELQKAR
ncbi:MAG: hypothetical protein WAM94_14995 [Chromatiaceae bacterium]